VYNFIPKNKLLFPDIICGEERSKIELFRGGFAAIELFLNYFI